MFVYVSTCVIMAEFTNEALLKLSQSLSENALSLREIAKKSTSSGSGTGTSQSEGRVI